ncbi:hypothetical protein T4A_7629 [Trichinella pseudospiralis]|uniref:Uncharacterized protein n=1 Tax=Trichinella pseudospiralis TaxID=6337 RepID=A0A0V1DTM8_TRIPS|nr:hypothetical protein T4A_9924 [Trichinella pseudospiralis]KRY65038.1 hypothetical protein T4A_7629 [Trichinella pseudospiralis]
MLMPLAFLPVNLVPAGFEILNVGTSGPVKTLFEYFQRDWLPAARILLWNVHGVVVRTCSWHNLMNKRVPKHYLEFYQFSQLITDKKGNTKKGVRQMNNGYSSGKISVSPNANYAAARGFGYKTAAEHSGRLLPNKIGMEHFLSAISYCTPEPLRLLHLCTI